MRGMWMAFALLVSTYAGGEGCGPAPVDSERLPKLLPHCKGTVQNALWPDKYPDMPTLQPGATVTIAEFDGPGLITHIHVIKMFPNHKMARGVLIEIYFDRAKRPAVKAPYADFFGNGCNGRGVFYSTNWLEHAPQTHNCFFPMPFKKHAQVVLRNETDEPTPGYSFVECEKIDEWDDSWGYFHATFQRKVVPVTRSSELVMIELKGTGHLVGHSMSVACDEPASGLGGTFWGEGNNEVDIDGKSCAIEYWGFEDAFSLSWGWQGIFKGLRNGTLVYRELGEPYPVRMITTYRFFDPQPIRFNKHLKWRVHWKYDNRGHAGPWQDAIDEGGFYIDVSTMHYWYSDSPAGYDHDLPPYEVRTADLLRSSVAELRGAVRRDIELADRPEVLVPGGADYEEWIEQHFAKSKPAVEQ